MLHQLDGKLDERVASLDQKCHYLERRNSEGVENLENTISELLRGQEQMRQSMKVIESTILNHKKRLEMVDMNRYLLLEDFAIFTQSKLPDLLIDTKVQIVEEINQQLEARQSSDTKEQAAKLDALLSDV